jgi:thiol-disulfide isomerase/thioredoxin
MKRLSLIAFLLISATTFSQEGFEIKVTFKPFKNQYIYLGHYFGKTYPIIDSAMLNDKSEAVFKGNKKLNGGIYLIGYPNKAGFFEILVDKDQKFSIIADTTTLANGATFENSPDNTLFRQYQQQMGSKGRKINELQQQLKTAANEADSTRILNELIKTDKEVKDFRENLIKKYPNNFLSALLAAMREPEMPSALKNPKTKEDSLAAYNHYKEQYWNGVNFWDGRLAYTTFFEEKLDKYFNQLVVPHPDSVIKEIDYMLGFASINEEMTRFLLIKFVNRYLNQKYMWEDAVFVHLFEKYFSHKNYSWLTDKGKKTITDRAYSLMANIMGTPAADIVLPDTIGNITGLYDLKAEYTLVVFWDPACSHCKEVLPRVDSFYHAKWKSAGLKIFAIAKEIESTRKDWLNFIQENRLEGWIHVFYSKAEEKTRIENNIPGYSQLYDVQSFPTLYLLDKEKRIVAKKLTVEQTDDVLQIKRKEN